MTALFNLEAERLQQHLLSKGVTLSMEQALDALAASKGYRSYKQAKRKLNLAQTFSGKRKLSKRALLRIEKLPSNTVFEGHWGVKYALEGCRSVQALVEQLYRIADTFQEWRQNGVEVSDNQDGHIILSTTNKVLAIKEGWEPADQ